MKKHNETKNKEDNKSIQNIWNDLKYRHKVTLIVAGASLILIGVFPIIIIFDIIYVIGYIHGWFNSCPNCKSFHAKQKERVELLDSRDTYKTVNRNDVTRNSKGQVINTTLRKETIPITLHTIKDHYKCKHCDHKWEGKERTVEEY